MRTLKFLRILQVQLGKYSVEDQAIADNKELEPSPQVILCVQGKLSSPKQALVTLPRWLCKGLDAQ